MKEIPLLKDVGLAKREALFMQKVELCTTVYRFESEMAMGGSAAGNDVADTRGKEVKRQTLMELLDFVNTQVSRHVVSLLQQQAAPFTASATLTIASSSLALSLVVLPFPFWRVPCFCWPCSSPCWPFCSC